MCGHTREVVIYFKFHRNPFRGFGAQGVQIWPFPLLWLVAFTTACTTVQAVTCTIAHSSRDMFRVTNNISETAQDKDIVAIKD